MKKKVIALLLCVVMVVCLAACGGGTTNNNGGSNTPVENNANTEPTPADDGEKVLNVAHKGAPSGLCIPVEAFGSSNGPVNALYGERLVGYNSETGEFEPCLATEWEYIDDTHIRFTLRDNVYAQDGTSKFTASDVIYTLKTAIEANKLGNYVNNFDLDGCEVEDDTHVIVALKAADPWAIGNFANVPLSMIVEAAVEANGGLDAQKNASVGFTGPYSVTVSEDTQVVLVRNETYWGDKPYYDKVVVKIIKDASSRIMALESGEVDVCLDPDTTQISLIEGNSNFNVLQFGTSNITVLHLNCSKAPLDDVTFRRAIALALNYEPNLKVAVNGFGEITDSYLPVKSSAYSKPDGSAPNYFHTDVEEAKKLIAESKYPTGAEIEILYAEGAAFEPFGVLIQEQLAQLGVTVKLTPLQQATLHEYLQDDTGSNTFVAAMINASNPDPKIITRYYDERVTHKDGNRSSYKCSQELLDLMDKAYVELDDAKRVEYYKQIQDIINEDVPGIPLYSPSKLCPVASKVQGVRLTIFNDPDLSKCYEK